MIGAGALPWIFFQAQPSVEFELVPYYNTSISEIALAWASGFLVWARRNLGTRLSEYDGLALFLFMVVAVLAGCAWPLLVLTTWGIGVVNIVAICKTRRTAT